ncbi:MAG: ATP-dependent helicase, partial [Caulobacteraceae bacterium]
VPEAYVHRIGRTARAGASGSAISLCADDERNLLKDIQKLIRQTLPSSDRRRDKALALLVQARGSQAEEPRQRSNGGGRGGQQQQQRRGAPGGSPGHAKAAPFSDKPVKRRNRPQRAHGSEGVVTHGREYGRDPAREPVRASGGDHGADDRRGLDAMLGRRS